MSIWISIWFRKSKLLSQMFQFLSVIIILYIYSRVCIFVLKSIIHKLICICTYHIYIHVYIYVHVYKYVYNITYWYTDRQIVLQYRFSSKVNKIHTEILKIFIENHKIQRPSTRTSANRCRVHKLHILRSGSIPGKGQGKRFTKCVGSINKIAKSIHIYCMDD